MNKKDHWESIYKDKSPLEVSWHQKKPTISLTLIKKIAQNNTDYIIDVGGGASTLSDFLLEDGFNNITLFLIYPLMPLRTPSNDWVINQLL